MGCAKGSGIGAPFPTVTSFSAFADGPEDAGLMDEILVLILLEGGTVENSLCILRPAE